MSFRVVFKGVQKQGKRVLDAGMAGINKGP